MIELTVFSSILVFSVIILVLVTMLGAAEKKLLPQGDARILINGDEENLQQLSQGVIIVLFSLAKCFYTISMCGGGGTCSQCKCQVISGGGDILPTEVSHFSRSEIKDNYRLACQVKVKGDLEVKIPRNL